MQIDKETRQLLRRTVSQNSFSIFHSARPIPRRVNSDNADSRELHAGVKLAGRLALLENMRRRPRAGADPSVRSVGGRFGR